MKRLSYITILVSFFTAIQSYAQFTEQLFRDTTEYTGGVGFQKIQYQNNYIVSGLIKNGLGGIICIDSNGNDIWQVTLRTRNPIRSIMLGMDGFVYTTVNENDTNFLWKLNPINGGIIWSKNYRAYGFISSLDYDSSTFIQSYLVSYDGGTYHTRFAVISKTTGDTLSSHFIGNISWTTFGTAMAVDQNKDIYFTHADSIIKVSATNPDSAIWRQIYTSAQIKAIQFLSYNQAKGSLYVLGTQANSMERGFIAKVNAMNGGFQKLEIIGNNTRVKPNQVKIVNNNLYASWQHLYVGGGLSYNNISKYDLVSDTMVWSAVYETPGGGQESVIDFDLDDSGYVYTTGYASSANYGPGRWINLKIHHTTGDVLNTLVLTENESPFLESLSNGFGIACLPTRILVFGNLERKQGLGRALTLSVLNPSNFNTILQKNFGNYLFPSRTIQIKKHPNGYFVTLKQVGRAVELEMFDTLNVLQWRKSFAVNMIEGHQLAVAPLGDIYFSATIRKTSIFAPFTSNTVDSICVFHLDKMGNTKGVVRRLVRLQKTAPLELIAGDSFAILLFHQNDTVYAIKTRNSAQLGLVNTRMIYQSTNESGWKPSFDKNESELYLFGIRFSAARIIKIRKHPFVAIDTLPLQSFFQIQHTNPIDTSRVLLLGRNFSLNAAYGVFNTTDMTNAWFVNAASTFNAYQTVIDDTKTHVYVIGKTSTNDIRIQKHLLANGNLLASYTYQTGNLQNETPLYMHYNAFHRKLFIAGTVRDNNNISSVFMMRIDTSLTFPKVYIRPNPIEGADRATCAEQVALQQTLVGGFVQKLGVQWGALFEVPDTFFCKSVFTQTSATACGVYNWNGMNLTNSGTYADTLYTQDGCDSIVTLTLTILPTSTTIQFDTACYSVVWRGDTLTQSGMYADTLVSINGCDSVIGLHLVIDSLNTSVTISQNGDTLISNQSSGTYQWIDCSTSGLITGAVNRSFTPNTTGSYKVVVSNGFCIDTSDCVTFIYASVNDFRDDIHYSVSPNPFSDYTVLMVPFTYNNGQIVIVNALGETMRTIKVENNEKVKIDRQLLPAGIYYFIAIFDDKHVEGKLSIID